MEFNPLNRPTEPACAFRYMGTRTPEGRRSMRLFTEHVMPALRELSARGRP